MVKNVGVVRFTSVNGHRILWVGLPHRVTCMGKARINRLSSCNQNANILINFSKIFEYKILWESVKWFLIYMWADRLGVVNR